MKFSHIANSASAIPRQLKLGLLILNHAFFIGVAPNIGVEITIASRRFEQGNDYKVTWFKYKKGIKND